MLQRAAHAKKELVFFKGLEDVVIGAAADGFEGRGNVVNRSDHDHRHFRIVLAHPFEEFEAIHLRHDHVAQDQVGSDFLHLLLCDASVLHGGAVIAFGFEHGRDDLSNGFFVIHDQYVFDLHLD